MPELKDRKKIFSRPRVFIDTPTHYCPGCGHGVVHRIISEVIVELDIQGKTIGVAPVGCSVFLYNYLDIDMIQAPHGRAPAVATGIKRMLPDRVVFTYQGDGDLAAIGTAETLHSASRGERIVIIFINNAIYGMTGGQMAPTTLGGQRSTTTPFGRDVMRVGYPLRITELIATLPGASYVARTAVTTPGNIKKTKLAIRKAFVNSIYNRGLSMVEVVSACPSGWGIPPSETANWIKEHLLPYYPLGELKVPEGGIL